MCSSTSTFQSVPFRLISQQLPQLPYPLLHHKQWILVAEKAVVTAESLPLDTPSHGFLTHSLKELLLPISNPLASHIQLVLPWETRELAQKPPLFLKAWPCSQHFQTPFMDQVLLAVLRRHQGLGPLTLQLLVTHLHSCRGWLHL